MSKTARKIKSNTPQSPGHESILQTNSHVFVELGMDGTITAASDAFIQAVGYSRHELIGRNHSSLLQTHEAGGSDLPPQKWTGLSRSAFGLDRADIAQG